MLIFNIILYLLWTGVSSSVSAVAFLGFPELKYMKKRGHRGISM
jgi:hypothetical protein